MKTNKNITKLRQRFILPDGKLTTSVKKYHDEWCKLAEPICSLTGAQMNGFDPSVQLIWGNKVIDLPVSFLVILNQSLKEKDNVMNKLEQINNRIPVFRF